MSGRVSKRWKSTRHGLAPIGSAVVPPHDTLRGSYGASLAEPPKRAMVAFHQDERGDWVAVLDCGHYQHVRHNPPMSERPWVVMEQGRASFLGYGLPCKKCLQGAPKDSYE